MRTLVVAIAVVTAFVWENRSGAQEGVVTTTSAETYVCPKCGKLHYRQTPTTTASSIPSTASPAPVTVRKVSVDTTPAIPMASTSAIRATTGISNVLGALNAQRSRRGIRALVYDPVLQAVAQRRAQRMAASGLKGHPSGSFSPGRYEGVGWSSSYSPSGVSACFTSDTRMRYAGAAMATGRDGVYFAVVYR